MMSNPQDIPILPTEIMKHILKYLEYKSLYSAKLTCKRWNEIIDEFDFMETALSKLNEFRTIILFLCLQNVPTSNRI